MPAAQAAAAVLPLMRADPWALGDIKSAIMVMLGVFSALVVMLEGWLWDEPYPGYGEVSQHLRDAQGHYHDLVEEKLDYLKSVQEEFVTRIQVERSRLRDRRQEIPFIMQERQRLIARFKTHLGHLQDVGRQALSVYRDTNRKARTMLAPKRFDESWESERLRLDRNRRAAADSRSRIRQSQQGAGRQHQQAADAPTKRRSAGSGI